MKRLRSPESWAEDMLPEGKRCRTEPPPPPLYMPPPSALPSPTPCWFDLNSTIVAYRSGGCDTTTRSRAYMARCHPLQVLDPQFTMTPGTAGFLLPSYPNIIQAEFRCVVCATGEEPSLVRLYLTDAQTTGEVALACIPMQTSVPSLPESSIIGCYRPQKAIITIASFAGNVTIQIQELLNGLVQGGTIHEVLNRLATKPERPCSL